MDKDEVKACIRALLSSSVISYRLNSLLYDFKKTSGCDLPLFEFRTPLEFLQSLHDTVQLYGDLRNPEVLLVQSEKSAHITSLVDRQKNLNVPHYLKRSKRVIIPKREQVDCNNGRKESECSAQTISYRGSEQLVKNTGYHDSYQQKDYSKIDSLILTEDITCKNRHISSNKNFGSEKSMKENINSNKEKENENNESFKSKGIDGCYFEDISDADSCYSTGEDSYARNGSSQVLKSSYCYVNDSVKNKLKRLIKEFPDGLWCCDLPNLYLDMFNAVLDYREFGYTSLIQMLSELPDVFRYIRPGNEDWILFDASVAPSSTEKKMMRFQLGSDITIDVKVNLQRLLMSFHETSLDLGIELDKIPNLYQKMFGTQLDFRSMGFKNLKSLFEALNGTFLNMFEVNYKFIVVPLVKTSPHCNIEWKEALPPITAENDIFYEIFPKDVVGPEESLLELNLSHHIAVGELVEVCVAEVWSPGKFFLQLNKFKDRLNKFMDDLQKFYNIYLNKYKMPDATIRPNQVCVGLYNSDPEYPEEWHRAKIVKVVNEKNVSVNFIDFGTVTRVKKSQLRFLHRSFQSFPIQAFQAELFGIIPLDDETKWPISVSKRFLNFLRVPFLEAEVVKVDFKKLSVSVILYDKCKEPISNINKILVMENLARYKETQETEKSVEEKRTKVDGPFPFSSSMETANSGILNSSAVTAPCKSFEISDEFLEADDLNINNYLTLPNFKMNCSNNSSNLIVRRNHSSEVKFEFDEVVDFTKADESESEDNAMIAKGDVFEISEEFSKVTCSSSSSIEDQLPKANTSSIISSDVSNPVNIKVKPINPAPSSLPGILKRLPPGLEHTNPVVNLPGQLQLYILQQQQDIKKLVNFLAVELLATTSSIKEVALSNPELALKIATQMAEAYVSSSYPTLPICCPNYFNPLMPPVFSESVREANLSAPSLVPEATALHVDKTEPLGDSKVEVLAPKMTVVNSSKVLKCSEKGTDTGKYVGLKRIGEKTLHLIRIKSQQYFLLDEIIHSFAPSAAPEVAETIFKVKRIKFDYRVLTKKTDEEILDELSSWGLLSDLKKKKKKKWEIRLLPANKVHHYLEALGLNTKQYEVDLKGFSEVDARKTKTESQS